MKLIKLKLNTRFRSLQNGFEIDFTEGTGVSPVSPICFVGKNASGKSNILEALANIFQYLDCFVSTYKPLGFNPNYNDPDSFELEWQYRNELKKHELIRIVKAKEATPKFYRKYSVKAEWEEETNKAIIHNLIPDLIIGYSSGQNEILGLPFLKTKFNNYNDYFYRLINELDYIQPESRLIYIDEYSSQAVLVSNYLMQEPTSFKVFENELGIKGVKQFEIVINNGILFNSAISLGNNNKSNKTDLTKLLYNSISKLLACCTSYYYDKESKMFYLDFLVNNETKKAFQTYFLDSLELFRTFQNLLFLNLYAVPKTVNKAVLKSKSIYVNETIPVLASDKRIFRFKYFEIEKKGVNEAIYYKNLSDGEHQFLYIIGTIMMHNKGKILFLLDEPETHFNPKWKYNYLDTLSKVSPKYSTQILITTHDPIMIAGLKKEQVVIVEKNDEKVFISRPEKDLKGMGVDAILTSNLFGFSTTLDKETEKLMIERRKLLLSKEKLKRKFTKAMQKRLNDLTEKLSEYDFVNPFTEPLYFEYLKNLDDIGKYSMPFISKKRQKKKARFRMRY